MRFSGKFERRFPVCLDRDFRLLKPIIDGRNLHILLWHPKGILRAQNRIENPSSLDNGRLNPSHWAVRIRICECSGHPASSKESLITKTSFNRKCSDYQETILASNAMLMMLGSLNKVVIWWFVKRARFVPVKQM